MSTTKPPWSARRIEGTLKPLVDDQGVLPAGWAERLADYLALLRDRNRSVNLVSRASADSLLEKQLVPSLACLLLVPADRPLRVLDIGTGGGLPGIPLKILRPAICLDLVEATRKKCTFLEEAVARLELSDTRVHWCRAEQPSHDLLMRAPFDLLLARAVGAPDLLKVAAARLLAPGGSGWRFVSPTAGGDALPWPPRGEPITALERL